MFCLSADGEISVFSVPDEVADHLEKYCLEFCCHWLYESPDAEKYRVKMGNMIGVCYTEKDFIEYLISTSVTSDRHWLQHSLMCMSGIHCLRNIQCFHISISDDL